MRTKKITKMINCCFCGKEVKENESFDAEPVKLGRTCFNCCHIPLDAKFMFRDCLKKELELEKSKIRLTKFLEENRK